MIQFNEADAPQSTKLLLATEQRFSDFIREFCKFENESLGYVEVFLGENTKIRVAITGRTTMYCQIMDVESGKIAIGRSFTTYNGLEYIYQGIKLYSDQHVISFRDVNVLHDNMVFVY